MDDTDTIKSLPLLERPREKLIKRGVDLLSNIELLAILLGTGSRKLTALGLANKLLIDSSGLKKLSEYSVEELKEITGIGNAKATKIKAAFELSKRLAYAQENENKVINTPLDIANILIARMGHLKQEKFDVVLLDAKNKIIAIQNIFKGSLTSTIVHPREVFKFAIKKSSAFIILAHNHPSGDLSPSSQDINLTKRLVEVGEVVGIEIIDHLIIGNKDYISLKNRNII